VTDLTPMENEAQLREILEKKCLVCVNHVIVAGISVVCSKGLRFPECRNDKADGFRLIDDSEAPEMWRHHCKVQGSISIAVGFECDWCGAEE